MLTDNERETVTKAYQGTYDVLVELTSEDFHLSSPSLACHIIISVTEETDHKDPELQRILRKASSDEKLTIACSVIPSLRVR